VQVHACVDAGGYVQHDVLLIMDLDPQVQTLLYETASWNVIRTGICRSAPSRGPRLRQEPPPLSMPKNASNNSYASISCPPLDDEKRKEPSDPEKPLQP